MEEGLLMLKIYFIFPCVESFLLVVGGHCCIITENWIELVSSTQVAECLKEKCTYNPPYFRNLHITHLYFIYGNFYK